MDIDRESATFLLLDLKEWGGHLESLAGRVGAIIRSRGGAVQNGAEPAMLGVFASGRGREADAAEAVRAALEIQALLSGLWPPGSPPRPNSIVIHSGLPIRGPGLLAEGGEANGVELTERLRHAAPAGRVLLSQETYRLVYGLFDVQRLPALGLEQSSQLVPAYLVLHARPGSLARTRRGVEGVETAMVGRTTELERLQTVFCAAVEKRELQAVTVLGEAGIGKSRLLHEFQSWLQAVPHQASLFCGRAEAETVTLPFSLMRDVFRSRFEILESDSTRVAREKFSRGFENLLGQAPKLSAHRVGQLLGFDFPNGHPGERRFHDPQQNRHQLFQSLSELFLSLSPVAEASATSGWAAVLVLDDLHWADDDSLDLLAHLTESCQGCPLLILSLARPALLERRPGWCEATRRHERLDLGPLSLRESELLVRTILSRTPQVPAALCETILAGAGGNPFYIEELIKVLIEQKVIVPAPGFWRVEPERLAVAPVSPTLATVLRARLDGLPSLERSVLQAAAVIGHVFWDSAVERLSGQAGLTATASTVAPAAKAAVPEALACLSAKELIQRRESSGFAGTVEYAFKHELLRDVAYGGLTRKSRREHHAEVAVWLVEHGGERIKEIAGLVAVHFEQAGRLANAAEWYGVAGDQARTGYAPASAVEYYQKALSLFSAAPSGSEQSQRLAWYEGLSEALTTQARFAEARASYDKVRHLAESCGDVATQIRAWNGLAFLFERRGDNRASIEAAEKAESLARGAGPDSLGELIRALHLKGWASYRMGDAPAVLRLAAQTLALCEQSGDRLRQAISFKLFGVAHLQLGRYPEADRYFQRGLELCLESGDRRNAGAMFSNLGESARLRGDYLAAVELYQKALAVAREIGERPSEMIYLSNLAGARLGLGQFKEAEADLREAIGMTGMPKSCTLSETFGFLASACLGQGKLTEALEAAHQAVVIGQDSENLLDLAGGWRALGQVLAAMSRAGPVRLPSSTRFPIPFGDPANCFAESLRLYETIGAENEQARTLLAWAELEQQQGRIEEARKKSDQAQTILGHLAEPRGANRMHAAPDGAPAAANV